MTSVPLRPVPTITSVRSAAAKPAGAVSAFWDTCHGIRASYQQNRAWVQCCAVVGIVVGAFGLWLAHFAVVTMLLLGLWFVMVVWAWRQKHQDAVEAAEAAGEPFLYRWGYPRRWLGRMLLGPLSALGVLTYAWAHYALCWPLCELVSLCSVFGIVLVLAVMEQPVDEEPSRWEEQSLRDAFVAAGAIKGGFTRLGPPQRDETGEWQTLKLAPGETWRDVAKNLTALASALDVDEDMLTVEHAGGPPNTVRVRITERGPAPSAEVVTSSLCDAVRTDWRDPVRIGVDSHGEPVHLLTSEHNTLIAGVMGYGKALALDTEVPTPSGWTTMGALKDGDEVYDDRGQVCHVVKAHDVRYERPCFEVTFSDGTVVVADEEHLWETSTHRRRQKARQSPLLWADRVCEVRNTREIADTLKEGNSGNHGVRLTTPLQAPEVVLPIEPYLLGVWLGDGSTSSGTIWCDDSDVETIDNLRLAGHDVYKIKEAFGWRIRGLNAALGAAGLRGNKHIPMQYLRASEGQRRAVLAGLLDTDGYCHYSSGQVAFAVTHERLANDAYELITSLGYKARMYRKAVKGRNAERSVCFTICFTPIDKVFRLTRKVVRQKVGQTRQTQLWRYITAVKPIDSVPVRCITVDSPSRLYLVTRSFVITHNTVSARMPLGHFLLDPTTTLYVADGKSSKRDYGSVAPSCERFVWGTDEDAPDQLLSMLRAVLNVVRDRNGNDYEGAEWPGLLLLLEEFQDIRAGAEKAEREEIDKTLGRIVRMGRAVSVHTLISTQRPSVEDLPSGTRNLIDQRLALVLRNGQDASLVLGHTPPKHLPTPSRKGEAIFADPATDRAVQLDYIDGQAWKALCARAAALRKPRVDMVKPEVVEVRAPSLVGAVTDALSGGPLLAGALYDRITEVLPAELLPANVSGLGRALGKWPQFVSRRAATGTIWRLLPATDGAPVASGGPVLSVNGHQDGVPSLVKASAVSGGGRQ